MSVPNTMMFPGNAPVYNPATVSVPPLYSSFRDPEVNAETAGRLKSHDCFDKGASDILWQVRVLPPRQAMSVSYMQAPPQSVAPHSVQLTNPLTVRAQPECLAVKAACLTVSLEHADDCDEACCPLLRVPLYPSAPAYPPSQVAPPVASGNVVVTSDGLVVQDFNGADNVLIDLAAYAGWCQLGAVLAAACSAPGPLGLTKIFTI